MRSGMEDNFRLNLCEDPIDPLCIPHVHDHRMQRQMG